MERDLAYQLMPGVMDFLQQLASQKVRTALVTSSLPEKVENVFQQLKLTGFFQEIVTADQIEHGKPSPDCYLLAAEKLQILPKMCIVFEDSASGVKAAHDAGMTVIGVNDPLGRTVIENGGGNFGHS